MEAKLFNQEWQEIGKIELEKDIFWLDVNNALIHRALVYQLANARKNIAHTKNRSEVRWSTRKLYRQKHTWNARAGSIRSPIRRKGWLAFWPRNTQNYSIDMNKKERRKALFCALSSKVKNKELLILDKIELKEIKTKKMSEILSKFPIEKNVLLVLEDKNLIIQRSSSNIANVKTILVNYLNIADLLKYKTLVLLKDSIDTINKLK